MDTASKILFGALGLGAVTAGSYLLFTDDGSDLLANVGGPPPPPPDAGNGYTITDTGYQNGQPFTITLAPIDDKHYLIPSAAAAFNQMQAAYQSDTGEQLRVNTAFRTWDQQDSMISKYGRYNEGGLANANGYSPHQRGIAVDIHVNQSKIGLPGSGKAWDWLVANASRFGFVNDYLSKGGAGEAWHLQIA